jgi:hypothetical protein
MMASAISSQVSLITSRRFAPLRYALLRFAPWKIAPLRFTSRRFAPPRFAFLRNDLHSRHSQPKLFAIDLVTIPKQEARGGLLRFPETLVPKCPNRTVRREANTYLTAKV